MKLLTTLTNYARGLAPTLEDKTASFLAPEVPVATAVGYYKSFDDQMAFQREVTERARGGTAKRLQFDSSDPSYNCTPNSLEIGIDDYERDQAGPADLLSLQQAKVRVLLGVANVSLTADVVETATNALTAENNRGTWDAATASNIDDPVREIDEQISAIANECGLLPNRILFGLGAWERFRNNPNVIGRQPGASLIGLTTGQASSMFLNPAIEVMVSTLSRDRSKLGGISDKANLVGDDVFIFHASANPTQWDPSFMKTFRTRRGGVSQVYTYRDDASRSDILAVDWTADLRVTSPVCGRRIRTVTGS